jgi:outer membrane protein assembly factor BamA
VLAALAALGLPAVVRGDSWSGVQSDPDGRQSPIVLAPAITVADVIIQGNRAASSRQIKALIRTRLGVKITDEDLRRDVRVLMGDRRFRKVEAITRRTTEDHVIVFFLITERASVPADVKEQPVMRVGQIFIVGNEKTRSGVILKQARLFPGQVLDIADLRKAEESLVRLDRFVIDRTKGIRPTVTVLPNPTTDTDSVYRDVLITIQDKEGTNYLDVLCDGFERWSCLLSLETRVRIAAFYLQCLYEEFRRLN